MHMKENNMAFGIIKQLEIECKMLKDVLKEHNMFDVSEALHSAEEKTRLLSELAEQ